MQVLVLPVVGGGNLGQETSDHLDDVLNGHATDFVLWTLVTDFIAIFSKRMHIILC